MTASPKLDHLLAVIPARGGSKGLPGKNIRPLAGLPLIVHSIRCARRCPEITRCVVSTDSAEIAGVARTYGGDVPFLRPAELAQDDTPMMPVLAHALREVQRLEGRSYGGIVLLDPTSPGRYPSDVAAAVRMLDEDPSVDGVMACSRPTFNPFWVGVVEAPSGYLEPAMSSSSDTVYLRRQDAPPFLRINGSLYVWRSAFVERAVSWREGRHRALEMPEARAFSIDDLYEFEVAELLVTHGLVRLPWMEDP